jgi:BMFP domain-containing protein YqiC
MPLPVNSNGIMMIDLGKIDDLVNRLGDSLPPAAGRLKEDAEKQFRSILKSAFEKMDLVSREEFDIQRSVLERTQLKLEMLELQLQELEKKDAG